MPVACRYLRSLTVDRRFALFALLLLATPLTTSAGECFQVAFAQDTLANDWRRAQVQELSDALASHPGICFAYSDAGGDTARQALNIERHADAGVDLIVTSPRDSQALTPVIARIHRRGIPVILLSRSINSDEFAHFIAADNHRIARLSADYIASALPNGVPGKVLILQGIPTSSTALARTSAFLERIGDYPHIEVVSIKPANYLRNQAIKVVEEILAEGIEFNAIYAQSDSMATGARMALQRAGIDPADLVITGIDYISEARDAIRAGLQDATFTYPTGGREGAAVILSRLKGEPAPKHITLESIRITRDNVDQIAPIF